MDKEKLRLAWENAFYRGTMCYIATLVTVIFGLQIYRFFISAPSSSLTCQKPSAMTLIPVLGVFIGAQ